MVRNVGFKQKIIALVYDFDGTLTPQPMQEYTVLPELGIDSNTFWKEVDRETRKTRGDPILTYMRLLVEKIELNKAHLSRKILRKLASSILYYPGVENWFDRINNYIKQKSNGLVTPRHYIVSAGLSEILEGISIKKHFRKIYASQYFFDHHETAKFPTNVINDTVKTQYLFRINKGVEDTLETINNYMPEENRPIPFRNIIYVGDGLTDVPSMTVVKKNGGFSIAVHKPKDKKSIEVCSKLLTADRIDFFAPANYQKGSNLEKEIKIIIDVIISRINFDKARFDFSKSQKAP